MHIKNAQTGRKTANINGKNLTVYNTFEGRRQQNRRTKTANIIKDDITLQHSDISAIVLRSNIIFCDICCFSSATLLSSSL